MQDRISDETELIQTYFASLAATGALGLHDDAALISIEPDMDLVVSTDAVRAGVHFFADDDARDIAWKALAVNVSDLIAKGATPVGYTMALALPDTPLKTWMAAFAAGLREAQSAFGLQLLGGDSDRAPGPLSVAITAFGKVPRGRFVRRTTARIGDSVFVTGTIGDSTLGLKLRQDRNAFGPDLSLEHRDALLGRYLRPAPNTAAIEIVRQFASAALDVSDGLIQDVTRLARGADASLSIAEAAVPLSQAAQIVAQLSPDALRTIVSGGDDFEILFAVAPGNITAMRAAARASGLHISEIGVLRAGSGVTLLDAAGSPMSIATGGYDHFRAL